MFIPLNKKIIINNINKKREWFRLFPPTFTLVCQSVISKDSDLFLSTNQECQSF